MASQKHATLFGLATVLCWSTVATAFKLSLNYLSPAQLILVASLSSWVFLVAVLCWRRGWRRALQQLFTQTARTYFVSMMFGLLNPTLYYFLLFSAYDRLPAQEAQAINYSWAIVLSLLAVPLLGQRMRRIDIAAAVICYLGVIVIATRGDVLGLEFANVEGVLFAVASTLIWSFYWIFNKQDPREAVLGLCLNFSFALPLIVLVCVFNGELAGLLSEPAWQGLVGGVYVGLFEMGLAFVLWLTAMKLAENTSKIANLIFISPFLSLFFINVFLGESILLSTLVGLGLIVVGLGLQQGLGSQE